MATEPLDLDAIEKRIGEAQALLSLWELAPSGNAQTMRFFQALTDDSARLMREVTRLRGIETAARAIWSAEPAYRDSYFLPIEAMEALRKAVEASDAAN